jgi:hypothetical protein
MLITLTTHIYLNKELRDPQHRLVTTRLGVEHLNRVIVGRTKIACIRH